VSVPSIRAKVAKCEPARGEFSVCGGTEGMRTCTR